MSSNGNRVVIGEPGYNRVRMYNWNGTSWGIGGIDVDGENSGNKFGQSVSLSADGNRMAVGAPFNSGNGFRSGHVRIYEYSPPLWVQLGADIDGEASSDESGNSVSLSADGNRVAIGAHFNNGGNIRSGHVRIYNWNGTNWTQLGADLNGEAAEDESGFSVSLSADGSRVAIGAPYNDGTGPNAGQVRTYLWNGSVWIRLSADIDGEAANDSSGYAVSLSADGNRVAIGAKDNAGNGTSAGHVRVIFFQ